MRIRTACCALILVSFTAAAVPASAQEAEDRASVGAFIAGLGLFDESGRPKTSTGIGSWLDVHIAGPLTLEGRVTWFPTKESVEFESQGGRTLKVMGGVQGTLVASRRVRLYGILEPGIIRFSSTATGRPDGQITIGPKTHFALDLGIGLTLFPNSRLTPRIDVVQTWFVSPGAVLGPPSGTGPVSAIATSRGKIADTFQISAGVGYRIGARQPVSNGSMTAPPVGRLTVGAQFASAVRATVGDLSPLSDPGVGAFLSYRLSGYLYLDGALSAFTRKPEVHTPWDGGRIVQGLAGIKVGVRKEGVGLFVKARAGVNSHSEAFEARDSTARTRTLSRSNGPALDLGGIVEIETGPRMRLRFEAGHLTAFYRSRTIVLDGVPVEQGSESSTASIQMALGVGWTF